MQPPTAQVNAAIANGNANQAALNAQSASLQGQYGSAVNQANDANGMAKDAANAIENGGDVYGRDLNTQEQSVGFNPASLTQANKNLTAIQNQVAYAPTAAQQSGNYYGTTAGGTTNIYSGLMANLNPGLTNATNAAGNLTNEYGQLTNAANQQAGLTVSSEQNKASDLANVYSSAVNQMQAAGATMASIEQLQQNQGFITAQSIAQYQNAYSNYITAQASATTAAANMMNANTNASIAPSTIAQQNATAAQTNASILKNQPGSTPTSKSNSGLQVGVSAPGSLGASGGIKLQ